MVSRKEGHQGRKGVRKEGRQERITVIAGGGGGCGGQQRKGVKGHGDGGGC